MAFSLPYFAPPRRQKDVGPFAAGFHSTAEERGDMAAFLRAHRHPVNKHPAEYWATRTEDAREGLAPILNRLLDSRIAELKEEERQLAEQRASLKRCVQLDLSLRATSLSVDVMQAKASG